MSSLRARNSGHFCSLKRRQRRSRNEVLTVAGLEVPPLQAVSDEQLAYARAVRARAAHGFLGECGLAALMTHGQVGGAFKGWLEPVSEPPS
ncbi:hypothetical protein D7X99_37725 [Corallococcus sp. AB032C]|nr:hypothetical protein D7X99_37725 [Corallococcus sp. AB032C]